VARRRKHWGWGFEDEQPSAGELRAAAAGLREHLGFGAADVEEPVPPVLPPPQVNLPRELAGICETDDHTRALHAHGASYLDVVRAFRGRFPFPPDAVARPRDELELARVLEWCADRRLAAVPYGGGTSVVGGVDPVPGPGQAGAVSIDLGRLDRVLEVDPVARSARIQAGAAGPRLEEQLGEHGLTLRFYPQSFQHSTLGGWIATRAAGHFATGPTHIDDLVEAVRAVTPGGEVWESRRLPASGAGPSPDRLLLGSEGTLAVITEAWVRVRPRPTERRSASIEFASFAAGLDAVRALLQTGLRPANCRLLEPEEARLTFAGDSALLVLGFEDVVEGFERAVALCRAHGGTVRETHGGPAAPRGGRAAAGGGGGAAWREAFLRAPYLRDTFVAMGVLSETFETAITWERLPAFVKAVKSAAAEAAGPAAIVTCRLTHAYPDGAAPYFTVLAPARRGDEEAQWDAIKVAAADAILAAGGTITHHHAVGRDHLRFYQRQRPEPFASALRAAKTALDPAGILNPGVLLRA
jgi:alkyldihydroxyacetonephosphate synthase